MKRKTKLFLTALFLTAITATFFLVQNSRAQTGELRVYFFDVGQGDSIFIKTPEGKDVLIDGGPNNTVLERLGEVMPFWDKNIDLVILTHPHADHINGLFDVLERYNVNEVLEPDFPATNDSYQSFNQLLESKKITKKLADDDRDFEIEKDLRLDVLWPDQEQGALKEINEYSVVTKLSYKNIDFLLTGDAYQENEEKIIDQNLSSEFLKVAHHGSRSSTSQEFLEKVHPLISVISVGAKNSYGHPTQDILNRLAEVKAKVLRTDLNGTIEVDVKPDESWVIKCEKTCS